MKKIVFFLLLLLSSQAGCTLTDPEVIELLQALQAQNDKLLEEIDQMKGQLTTLDGKYQTILAGLADNKKDLEALKAQVEALKTQIADQLKKIDQLNAQLTQQGADIVKLSAELAAVKASLADLLVKFEQLVNSQSNQIFYDQNGTIKCPAAKVGDKGFVNGKQYEAVDRTLLIKRRDESADLTCVCTTLVTDMSNLFLDRSFNQPIGNWDVSNVTTMFGMFRSSNFNQDISKWNVSKVSNMNQMFFGSFFNQPLNDWNVLNVENMDNMFFGSKFNQPIGKWNVTKVKSMASMFRETIFNQDISTWNVSKVENMAQMFYQAKFNGVLNTWDVSSVTNMNFMFTGSEFNQTISGWNVGNVLDMSEMFRESQFNQPIGSWNTAKVTTFKRMFYQSKFNQEIGTWNTSNVLVLDQMFMNSVFNKSLGSWNVSKVTSMNELFFNSPFNQNISTWCVTNIKTEPTNFSAQSPLTTQNKPNWGTCPSANLVDKYPAGSVFGAVGPTIIVDVTNPKTGKTWMDRNLGASRAATSSTDAAAYGDLYQWGRGADGHQLRTSATTSVLSSSNQPGNSNFIVAPSGLADWRSPQNNNLWQGVNGTNNPCPSGYRIPTESEQNEERLSWETNTLVGAFNSPLKWTVAGFRLNGSGSLNNVGTYGGYWSSTVSGTNSRGLGFNSGATGMGSDVRADGRSVRCIKN